MISIKKFFGKKDLGNRGEDLASRYLKKKGFKVLSRNFYCRGGEIDLVAEREGELYFVEVKTRRSRRYGLPVESVKFHKKKRMACAAHYYLLKNSQWENFPKNFSVVSIDFDLEKNPRIEFFPNAFEMEGDYY